MNDKLICPFCNKPLQPTLRLSDEYWCENYDCPRTNIEWVGSQKLWQELIRTRKALDVAVDKLKGIKAYYDDSYDDPHTFVNWHIVAQRLANDADDAIKAITALEQKDVK